MTGIEKAISIAGSQYKLGKLLGVTQAAVNIWKTIGYVPKQRSIEISEKFGIPRDELISEKARIQIKYGR